MTDAELGQLQSTQDWYSRPHPVGYVTSWDDEAADITREQERDARDCLVLVHCRDCGDPFWTDDPDDVLCGAECP